MLLKILEKKKKKDGHATHHFVRTPHPEHVVPLNIYSERKGTGQEADASESAITCVAAG